MANIFKVHSGREANKNSNILFLMPSNQLYLFSSYIFTRRPFLHLLTSHFLWIWTSNNILGTGKLRTTHRNITWVGVWEGFLRQMKATFSIMMLILSLLCSYSFQLQKCFSVAQHRTAAGWKQNLQSKKKNPFVPTESLFCHPLVGSFPVLFSASPYQFANYTSCFPDIRSKFHKTAVQAHPN